MLDGDGKPGETVELDAGIGIEMARARLGDLVLRAGYGNERITLTRKGKPVAALVGLKDLNRLQECDAAESDAADAA